MFNKELVAGVVFDGDDTIFNNLPDSEEGNLHERSRRSALHRIGRERGIEALANLSAEDNLRGFRTARTHSLPGAVWNILHLNGIVNSPDIDNTDPLLREIINLKNKLHESILRENGVEVNGATHFIQKLLQIGLVNKLAIASSSIRRDIDIFLEITKLESYFPPDQIISIESVTKLKPDPEPFVKARNTLGLTAMDEVWAFEDDPRGIESAKAAGLLAFAITTRYDRAFFKNLPIPPDFVADSWAEFEEKLLG